MTEFISAQTLASYPGVTISNAETADLVVSLTNGLITDVVGEDLDPIPFRVKTIAYEVAARALRNPEGAESITKGVDDWKKTVRYSQAEALRAGVYLTDEEKADLLGKLGGTPGVGSIRMHVPGYDRRTGSGLNY